MAVSGDIRGGGAECRRRTNLQSGPQSALRSTFGRKKALATLLIGVAVFQPSTLLAEGTRSAAEARPPLSVSTFCSAAEVPRPAARVLPSRFVTPDDAAVDVLAVILWDEKRPKPPLNPKPPPPPKN